MALKHEMMAPDEWHDNGPQDLITVSLCIQIAIDKMQLCSSSEAYACPYHNLTATVGHSVHNFAIIKLLAHTMPYTWFTVLMPIGRTAKFSKTKLEAAYGRVVNTLATALVDIPALSMPIARSLKTWDICGIVLCDKTAHFRWNFYCPQHKVHLCNDHAI